MVKTVNLSSNFYRFISYICTVIIKHKAFEAFSLCVILMNSVILCITDPNEDTSITLFFEILFLILYTIEMCLKILSMGFILNKVNII